ncbi:MAG TPA: isoaspartyl peptidase/L-asparaginase [Patescibacteria group bacterium]|nr:isoaspartyl peptidase/L-asparaginase [Patescibacteria group bacterium]
MNNKYSLMIHGGAGLIQGLSESEERGYLEAIHGVLEKGETLLRQGASALNVVEFCVMQLEDDPQFNAGKGSVLDANGNIEMDAAIMEGREMRAGSVAGVRGVKNPISVARRVMEKTEHVMLIGEGLQSFVKEQGFEIFPDSYFKVEKRVKQWQEAKKKDRVVLDHDSIDHEAEHKMLEKKFGTVGAVARDRTGNLAAATSTGGIVNKKYGRVGDSPIVGAGVYADNATCAVSATGYGEQFIRSAISKTISDFIEMKNMDASRAAREGMGYLVKKVKGLGGVIVVDHEGNCSDAFTTGGMIRGFVREGEDMKIGLYSELM